MALLEPILAGMSVGLSALARAAGRAHVEIGADKLLHLPPIRPMDEEVEPRKTREMVFRHIGPVQLPRLLLEDDAATRFSEASLARRPSSRNELPAVYGALLAHGADIDANGVGSMIPGIDAAHIATAMRAVELSGRLRRANDRFRNTERRADRGVVRRRHQGLGRHDGHGRQPTLVDSPSGSAAALPQPCSLTRAAASARRMAPRLPPSRPLTATGGEQGNGSSVSIRHGSPPMPAIPCH